MSGNGFGGMAAVEEGGLDAGQEAVVAADEDAAGEQGGALGQGIGLRGGVGPGNAI